MARRAAVPGASIWAVASASSGTSSGASAATGIRARRLWPWINWREASARPASTNLFTAHVLPECSPLDVFPEHDWLDLNPTYTYEVVHRKLQTGLEAGPGLAVLLGRVDLRGGAQRFGASDPAAGLLVGAVRRQWPLYGQQADLAVRRRLAGRARPAGIRGDGALGRVLPRAAVEPSWCPISTSESSPRVWARRGDSTA